MAALIIRKLENPAPQIFVSGITPAVRDKTFSTHDMPEKSC